MQGRHTRRSQALIRSHPSSGGVVTPPAHHRVRRWRILTPCLALLALLLNHPASAGTSWPMPAPDPEPLQMEAEGFRQEISSMEMRALGEQIRIALAPAGGIPLFETGRPAEVFLRTQSGLAEPVAVEYTWQLADAHGKRVASGSGTFRVTPGAGSTQTISLPTTRTALYTLQVVARRAGSPQLRERLVLAVVSPAPKPEQAARSRLGLNLSGPLTASERSLIPLTGAGWARIPIRWGELERKRGCYTLDSELEATLAVLSRAGIRAVASLHPENPLYPADLAADAAWERFCQEIAGRFTGPSGFHAWEIVLPAGPRAGGVSEPSNLLAAAATAIRAIDPEATVIVSAEPSGHADWAGLSGIAACPLTVADLPAVTLFPKPAPVKPGAPRPLYLATLQPEREAALASRDPLSTAGSLARALLAGLADERIDALFVDPWIDRADSPAPFALAHPDLTPTPALLAYRTVAGLFRSPRLKARIKESFVRGYLFEEGRGVVAALWSPSGEGAIAIKTGAARVTVTDALGAVREYPCHEGMALLPIGPIPCYVRLSGGPVRIEPFLSPLQDPIVCRPGEVSRTRVYLRNPFRRFQPGALRLVCPPGWRGDLDYPDPGRRARLQAFGVQVMPPAHAEPGAYQLELWIDGGTGTPVQMQIPLTLLSSEKEAGSAMANAVLTAHTHGNRVLFPRVLNACHHWSKP